MTTTIADMARLMEKIAPARLAEDWDNIGLQVGRMDWPVRTVWIALDPLPEVVTDACRASADLLITHHPLIFKPLKTIDFSTTIGGIIDMAARHRLGIFAAHTNLDSARGGINDVIAERIGLRDTTVLSGETEPESGQGIGRVGRLETPMRLDDFARKIKQDFSLAWLRYTGNPEWTVRRVALCSGSGGSLMKDFFASGADVYLTGDLRYHDARDAENARRGLIDIGHFASEHLMVDVLAGQLETLLEKESAAVSVVPCRLEQEPFVYME